MYGTKPLQRIQGVGLGGLPLLFLMWISCGEGTPSSPSIELSDSLLTAYKVRLYPYIAGARAARDSITSYRWEIAQQRGDTIYFGISRPTRSLYGGRREGVVGRFVPADTGFAYYEELFWTYRFPADTIGILMKGLLENYRQGVWDTMSLLECCVSFPDRETFYDVKRRQWVRKWRL